MTPEEFFADDATGADLFELIRAQTEALGTVGIEVSKSQVAFRRRRVFAAVWRPARYLQGRTAPLVLTVYLIEQDPSPRWKEVVEPAPGRFTHHLEIWNRSEVDSEVAGWLRQAWDVAGTDPSRHRQ